MGIHKARVERYEQYREYKEQGHTLKEVTEHFGISRSTASNACKGVAPQKAVNTGNIKNQYTCQSFDREQNAIRTIEERAPGFEYAGGFTHCDGRVLLRCKKCGSILWRSMISVRKRSVACEICKSIDATKKKEEEQKEKDDRRRQKEEAHESALKRKELEEKERSKRLEQRKHPCPVCGTITTNKVCCSTECATKKHNHDKDIRRRIKLASVLVDRDITIEAVYSRDGGRCYLCGCLCDWEDREQRQGTIICGNSYPSIDHVVPLAAGGRHEWSNVRLAHRGCNSKKSDKHIPLGQKNVS